MTDLNVADSPTQPRIETELPRPVRTRDIQDLVAFLGEFDLALHELQPEQASMFVAARNLAECIDDLAVPVARPESRRAEPSLAEEETEEIVERLHCLCEALDSRLPTDEMDVSGLHNTEDLPRIFPTQWLLEEFRPEVFYAKAAEGELFLPVWQSPRRDRSREPVDAPAAELVEDCLQAHDVRQHAYVLLDTSRTMADRDRRGTVARGIALAFLLQGFRQRARLAVRPFTAEVGELSAGVGRHEFRAMACRVAELPNAGQTRIQAALERAVADIRSSGACRHADILLITDGLSRITRSPLGDEKLHTYLLGDLFENEETASGLGTLKSWSSTFRRVWTNRFAEILAPRWRDVEAAGAALRSALERAEEPVPPEESARLARLRASVEHLLREYQRGLGKADAGDVDFGPIQSLLEQPLPAAEPADECAPGAAPTPRDEAAGEPRVRFRVTGIDLYGRRRAWWQVLLELLRRGARRLAQRIGGMRGPAYDIPTMMASLPDAGASGKVKHDRSLADPAGALRGTEDQRDSELIEGVR